MTARSREHNFRRPADLGPFTNRFLRCVSSNRPVASSVSFPSVLIVIFLLILITSPALAAGGAPVSDPASSGGLPAWIVSTLAFLGTVKVAMSFIEPRLNLWLRDKLNDIAASEMQDDDDYLRGVFATPQWRTYCFLGRLLNINLPTLAELERAIRLQREAAIAAGGNLREP
jgi:hypothetical protein